MKYFLHDTNARNDEKVTLLFIKFGYEGVGLFYSILEILGSQEKPVNELVLKSQLKIGKKLEKQLNFMYNIGILSIKNGDVFNENILKVGEKYQIKKEKTREKVSQWREKQTDKNNVTSYKEECNHPKVNKSKINEVYKYSKFYDEELKKTSNPTYEAFVQFLFGDNEFKKPLAGVLKIRDQISADDFEKLLITSKAYNKTIRDAVLGLENKTAYHKGKVSFYYTLNNWLKNEKYS